MNNKERAGVNPDKLNSRELGDIAAMAQVCADKLGVAIGGQISIMRQHPDLFGSRHPRNIEQIQAIAQSVMTAPETVAPPAAAQTAGTPDAAPVAAEYPPEVAVPDGGPVVQDSGYNFAADAALAHAAYESSPELTVAAAGGYGSGQREVIDTAQPAREVRHDEYVDGISDPAVRPSGAAAEPAPLQAEPLLSTEQQDLLARAQAQLAGVLADQQPAATAQPQQPEQYGLAA